MTRPRPRAYRGGLLGPDVLAIRPFGCETCGVMPIAGVLFDPARPDRYGAYVERCDSCLRYDNDLAAAKVAADYFGMDLDDSDDDGWLLKPRTQT